MQSGNLGIQNQGSVPGYAQNGFNPFMAFSGLGGLLGGMFGDQGSPYGAAMGPYQQYNQQAANGQNPFLQAGQGAVGNYQNWLQGMQNPSQFINGLMGQYQQSPWAKYQQQAATRGANNLGSASGLTGSTPLQLQAQQNAGNISSQDQQNWLQNVLGINNQYGMGQQNLMNSGQNAANALTGLYGNEAQGMGNLAYGQQQGNNQDFMNELGGGLQLAGSFFGL